MGEKRIRNKINAVSAASAQGPRPKDEDYVLTESLFVEDIPVQLLMLLDGMGGGEAGEEASELAAKYTNLFIENLIEKLHINNREERHQFLKDAIKFAHKSVSALAEKKGEGIRCGSTLALILLIHNENEITCDAAWIGDSRIYLIDNEGVSHMISKDHSTTGEMVEAGYIELWEIEDTPGHNQLTRSLGNPKEPWEGGEIISLDEHKLWKKVPY